MLKCRSQAMTAPTIFGNIILLPPSNTRFAHSFSPSVMCCLLLSCGCSFLSGTFFFRYAVLFLCSFLSIGLPHFFFINCFAWPPFSCCFLCSSRLSRVLNFSTSSLEIFFVHFILWLSFTLRLLLVLLWFRLGSFICSLRGFCVC